MLPDNQISMSFHFIVRSGGDSKVWNQIMVMKDPVYIHAYCDWLG